MGQRPSDERVMFGNAAGGVIIGGSTTSADLPVANAVQPRCQPASATACNDMFVARFDASGRSVTFSTFLGGGGTAMLQSIAADAYGKIVVAATVSGTDLPIRRGAQPANGAGPITASFDGGRTWRAVRIAANEVRQFALTRDTARVYAATDRGVWWSADGGATWTGTADAPAADVRGIAIDPARPLTVYAATELRKPG